MIEQLEQIRNLSAATDNSITSDQKIEARENNKKNLWNGKHISFFGNLENLVRFFHKWEKYVIKFLKKDAKYEAAGRGYLNDDLVTFMI